MGFSGRCIQRKCIVVVAVRDGKLNIVVPGKEAEIEGNLALGTEFIHDETEI